MIAYDSKTIDSINYHLVRCKFNVNGPLEWYDIDEVEQDELTPLEVPCFVIFKEVGEDWKPVKAMGYDFGAEQIFDDFLGE